MRALRINFLIGFVFFCVCLQSASAEIYSLLRITVSDKSDITEILTGTGAGESVLEYNFDDGYIDVYLNSEELRAVSALGYGYEILIPDVEKHNSQQFAGLTMGGFRTFSEIVAKLDSLQSDYPALLRVDSIGHSHENNAIWAVKVSDNVDIEEGEPEVLITGITHAREPIGGEICIDFMEWLCENYGEDPNATHIVNERQVWFIPTVNPDGYLYNQQTNPNGGGMWRKNRRNNGGSYGVDNNRNYTYMWGYDNNGSSPYPSSETYRGPSAGSEPENQAVMFLCEEHNFQLALHYHGGSENVLHAWGYDHLFTPDHHFYRSLGDSLASYSGYPVGMTWQQMYPSNGNAYDYSYGEITAKNRIFGFVPEAGPFWPNQSNIPGLVAIHRNYNLAFSLLADNIWRAISPGGPQIQQMDTSYTGDYTVSWDVIAGDTIPDRYELQEVSGESIITDGAENGSGNWILDGYSLSTTHHSGSYGFYSGGANSYHAIMTLSSPVLIEGPTNLTFYINYNIESNYDYGFVEVSTDGINFESLATYTGNSGGWSSRSYSLNPYIGEYVYIRFRYDTDIGVSYTGMYVDDIYPVQTYSGVVVLDSNITAPNYQIVDQQLGEYAYRVRARNVSGWGVFGNTEDIVVEPFQTDCDYVAGDVNDSGDFNGLDVTYSIAYFKGAPPPPYQCECTLGETWHVPGDANGSCNFNGLDVTYMVAYLKGGPDLLFCVDCPPTQ
ncbi:MAG: immune inhibitor A [Candidatus Zixiibacteriota bacterium]|nr:MAG: immune inhibitor A [candidate division Zixibacteria bacterium]